MTVYSYSVRIVIRITRVLLTAPPVNRVAPSVGTMLSSGEDPTAGIVSNRSAKHWAEKLTTLLQSSSGVSLLTGEAHCQ
jgi:hypothetical protein